MIKPLLMTPFIITGQMVKPLLVALLIIMGQVIRPLLVVLFIIMGQVSAKTPLVLGHSLEHDSKLFQSSRRYKVYLPADYQVYTRDWPVLYVIDGDFHFRHVAALVDNLHRTGAIPGMLVVGVDTQGTADYIANTTDVMAGEAKPGYGNESVFRRYLKQELIPLIEKNYRVSNRRALAGYSLGGYFTLMTLLKEPGLFAAYLSMSPSAWYGDYQLQQKFSEFFAQHPELNAQVFLSLANERGMGVYGVVEAFSSHAPAGVNWTFKRYPQHTHYSMALPALLDAMSFLFPNYALDGAEIERIGTAERILGAFEDIDKRVFTGFNFGWWQSYVLGKYFVRSENTAQLKTFARMAKARFPASYSELVLRMCVSLIKAQHLVLVRAFLEETKETGHHQPLWHQQNAALLVAQGKTQLAQRAYRRALRLAAEKQWPIWQVMEIQGELDALRQNENK